MRKLLFYLFVIFAGLFTVLAQNTCDPPCQNDGICLPGNACRCVSNSTQPQWAGNRCEVPICNPTCKAGSCSSPGVCNCTGTGFMGPLCETWTCETPCANGVCVGPNQCDCDGTAYVGPYCQIPICDPPCINNGTCVEPNVCSCDTAVGWTGDLCEIPVCDNITCNNNGTCVGPNVCDCRGTGYAEADCSFEVDECMAYPPPCDAATTCTNTNGSYTCSDCPSEGYLPGNGKEGCQAICEPPCQNGGRCSRPNQCDCSGTGFQGAVCDEDINECKSKVCDSLVVCANTYGGFVCGDCPGNYTGNGYDGCNPICDPPCSEGYHCASPYQCASSPSNKISPPWVMVACIQVAFFASLYAQHNFPFNGFFVLSV